MKLKMFFLFFASILIINTSRAQDKIYKRNDEVIDALVKQVGAAFITYKRSDNPNGPEYTIKKDAVKSITYQNGTEDVFDAVRSANRSAKTPRYTHEVANNARINYKSNILAIAPFQFTENGLGFSLSYERSIDKPGIISFYLPAVISFSPTNNNSNYNGQNQNHTDLMYYAMPGIKIYPTGNKAKVKYAIGPSIVIASGEKTSYNYDSYSGNYIIDQQQRFVLGLLVQNYLNINPTPHLFLGIEMGMGASYINQLAGINQNTAFLIQGAFKLGYRF